MGCKSHSSRHCVIANCHGGHQSTSSSKTENMLVSWGSVPTSTSCLGRRSKRKQIIYHTRGGGTLWKSTQTHAPVAPVQISPRGASVAPWMSNSCGNPIVKDLSEAELLGYGEAFSWRIGSFITSAGNHHRDICLSLCLNESGPWTRHLRLRIAHLRSVLQREESLWKASHVKRTRLVADGLTKLMVGQAFSAFAQLLHVPGGSSQEICLIQR